MENHDISKQTIVVLVFLAILVSVLGTFTILNQANENVANSVVDTKDGSTTSAKVAINILNNEPLQDSTTAKASIEIV